MSDKVYEDDLPEADDEMMPVNWESQNAEVLPTADVKPEVEAMPAAEPKATETADVNTTEVETTSDEDESNDEAKDEAKLDVRNELYNLDSTPYEEKSKVVGDVKRQPSTVALPLTSYMQNPAVTLSAFSIANQEVDENLTELFNPYLLFTMDMMAKGDWVQNISHKGKSIGPRSPRLRSTGGELAGKAALVKLRRRTGGGVELTFELPHTGLVVTMTPVHETKLIDLDFTLTAHTARVGLMTTGLLLSARSGIFSNTLIELAIDQIISTNLKVPKGTDMRETLLSVIDPLDYPILIWGLQASKSPSGHPWTYRCSNPDCQHEHDDTLNFGRAYWLNRAALTEKQLDILTSVSSGVTLEDLETYREEFADDGSEEIELDSGVKIVFGRTNMTEFLASTDGWCTRVEKQYANSLRDYATDKQRSEYLRSIVQSSRMNRYAHMVKRIVIPDVNGIDEDVYENNTPEEREIVRVLLEELSSTTLDFDKFEGAVLEYIDNHTVAVIGYPAVECPKCNFVPKTKSGALRSIVPIPIDRVFFTLVQQKVSLLAQQATM